MGIKQDFCADIQYAKTETVWELLKSELRISQLEVLSLTWEQMMGRVDAHVKELSDEQVVELQKKYL